MFKKLILTLAIVALTLSFAGTVPGVGGNYKITLLQPSVVKGKELKAGEYRLNLAADKVTIVSGKQSVEVPVKVETAEQKFDTTAIRYTDEGGKPSISEIRLGGTRTKLVFNP
jgi:predicted secreted protein